MPAMPPPYADKLLAEQVKLIQRHLPFSLLGAMLTGFFLFWSMWQNPTASSSAQTAYWLWNAAQASIITACWLAWRHFARQPRPQAQRYAYRVLFTCTLLIGCLWALAIVVIVSQSYHDPVKMVVLAGLHFGLLGGATASIAIWWRVYCALAVPSILAWTYVLILVLPNEFNLLGFATLVLLVADVVFAFNVAHNTRASIRLRFENLALIEQLKEKSELAEQASLAKTRFLASASHDLRQPIHALNLFIAALESTPLDSKQQEIVQYAKTACFAGQDMLNTILDYSQIESGSIQAKPQTVALAPILRQLEEEFGMQADVKDLIYRTRDCHYSVTTDAALLALVLRNFVSNAIRYTHRGGVLVAAHRRGSHCHIGVWDTGVGIAKTKRQTIFKAFHQLEDQRNQDQGLGLGLAIVEKLCEILGLTVTVKSCVGRGSAFIVTLPLVKDFTLPSVSGRPQSPSKQLQNYQVLVVDDDPQILAGMQALLGTWGCAVKLARSVSEAQQCAQQQPPQLLVTDYRLEHGEDGKAVIEAVKRYSPNVDIIMMTGDTAPELIRTTRQIAPILLHKPISPAVLLKHLEQLTAQTDSSIVLEALQNVQFE